ncbi:MAG TPA: hypothetical protein PKH94_00775 [Bacteroidales bacterium]|nr:hypothetical protein [Bacteroidales bacterium]HNS45749.1 hypothetical protein [Bacteroidales bacterium]
MARVKYILYVVIVVALFLPLFQHALPVFSIKPLQGSYVLAEEPVFSFRDYFTGKFQEDYNAYYEQHLGFRPLLVRINNQIAFSCFNLALAQDVILGKKGYLYEVFYIKATLGRDFTGTDKWDRYVQKLKAISDSLDRNGTTLLVVFAPGKGTFFPEYIPDKFKPWQKDTTNQEYLMKKLEENRIRFFDANHWFTRMKDSSPYPLYPKTGIHWSHYGAGLFMDSIVRYMERVKGKEMVDFGWTDVRMSNDLQEPDNDIASGMNLLFGVPHYTMPYPEFCFRENTSTFKPVVITIADSYYWILHGNAITQKIYAQDKFWYYFQAAHGAYPEDQMVKDLDIAGELKSADFVILMATDATLSKFDFGFTDQVYDLITVEGRQAASKRAALILTAERDIRNNKEWMETIKAKASKRNISVDEMIHLDAVWMVDKKLNEEKQ